MRRGSHTYTGSEQSRSGSTGDVSALDDSALDSNYDPRTIQRGLAYASQKRTQITDSGPNFVEGTVKGSGRHVYTVHVSWLVDDKGTIVSDACSCPVGYSCKHSVALLETHRRDTQQLTLLISQLDEPTVVEPSTEGDPQWRKYLTGLDADDNDQFDPAPLAIEIGIATPKASRYAPDPDSHVTLRPLRIGAKGNWIRSGVSWRDLSHGYDYALRGLDQDQLAALRMISSIAEHHSYSIPATFSVGACRPRVWRYIQNAIESGVVLVRERSGVPVILADTPAGLEVDLRSADDGAVSASTQLTYRGERISLRAGQAGLIGNPAHGLFVESDGQLHLVPLAKPLNATMSGLAKGPPLLVPRGGVNELLDEYTPLLAEHASVISSDTSVTIEHSEFVGLVATINRPTVNSATLSWAARYARGERISNFVLSDPRRRGRDLQAEHVALVDLELPTHLMGSLLGWDLRPASLSADGADAVRLLTEVAPWLTERGQVTVEVHGDSPELREATTDPLISMSVSEPQPTGTDNRLGIVNDWFDLSIEVSIDDETIEFSELFTALSSDEPVLILDSGTWLRLDRPEFDKLRDLIDEARGLLDPEAPVDQDTIRINRFQSSWWNELASLGVVATQSKRWAQSVSRLALATAPEPVAVPSALKAVLRPYQKQGLDWLAFLYRHRLGGILADDMGLGKTVQTLALFLHILDESPDRRFLVVAPTSVVENWHREAAQFAPGVQVKTIDQTHKKRGTLLADEVGDATIVVTSYALFRLDYDDYCTLDWEMLVLDEAQFVKNHRGKTYQCVRRLPAQTKLAITGTPLENSLMDLWSLLSIAAPGLYPDPQRFSEVYRRPIESGKAPQMLETLRRRITPIMRRRTKGDVLADLPPKIEQVVEVELSPRHSRIYQTQLQRQRQKVLGLVDDVQKNRFEILKSLTLLRQLSLDPGLVDPAHDNIGSAKLDQLIEDVTQVVAEGHKALVFSQFTRYLTLVKGRLDDAGIAYSYLDGRTRKRDRAISAFKDGDIPVFVISLKAGGFGLNLTEADYCFVLDPWWNPAVETQAVDRTHRIGQQNQVMVYRYVSVGTIEEKVMELKERKAALFSSVMDADGSLSGPLTEDDIRGLFN